MDARDQIPIHLKAQQGPMKAALVELVRIPSVCDEGGGGYPSYYIAANLRDFGGDDHPGMGGGSNLESIEQTRAKSEGEGKLMITTLAMPLVQAAG